MSLGGQFDRHAVQRIVLLESAEGQRRATDVQTRCARTPWGKIMTHSPKRRGINLLNLVRR